MAPRALLISSFDTAPVLILSFTSFVSSTSAFTSVTGLFRTSTKCSHHLSLTSSSLVSNLLSFPFTIATFFGPSLQSLLVALDTPFICPCRAASSASCATLFTQSLLSFLRLLFVSLSFSLYSFQALFFSLSDLASSIFLFSFLLSSIFLQLSVLIQL